MVSHTETAQAFKAYIHSDRIFADRGKPVDNQPMLDSKRGAMLGHLEELCGGVKERHTFLRYVFGVDSSTALTCRQQNALYLWLAPKPADLIAGASTWVVTNPRAKATAAAVLAAALIEAGQMELEL
jgi:hypothetical protein